MNADRLPELDRIARKVVKDAQKPGGLLEKAEFTMGVARRQIAERMQLGNGELDDGKWKKLVKEAVMKYLVGPAHLGCRYQDKYKWLKFVQEGDEDEPEAGPSRSPSPPVKKKAAPTTKNKKSRSPSKVVEDEKVCRSVHALRPRVTRLQGIARVCEPASQGSARRGRRCWCRVRHVIRV